MKRLICLLSVIVVVSAFTGCKGPEGPAGPALTGDIIGYVVMIDNNDNYLQDNSSVTVSIEGTNISASTASDGRFILSGVSTGTYTIAFSKTGFGTMKIVGYSYAGGGQAFLDHTYLSQIPAYTITGLTSSVNSGYIVVSGKYSGALPVGTYTQYKLFISTAPTVSSNPQNYNFCDTPYSSSDSFSTTINSSDFKSNKIQTGQKVYIVAYTDNSYSTYIDIATGKYVYPSLNPTPSNVVSVVVP